MSAPSSARDNLWRQARAVSEESPLEAARIASELMNSTNSAGVQEELVRSVLTILSDPAVLECKHALCSFIADISRHPSSPACLMLMGEGVTILANQMLNGDNSCRAHATQALMNLGRSPGFHPEVVVALVGILRDVEAPPAIKTNACRALHVVSFYDDGKEIINIGAVTDVVLAMSQDAAWDSFASRILTQLTAHPKDSGDKVMGPVIEVCNGQYSTRTGPCLSHLARTMAVLSDENKAKLLQSYSGVEQCVPVVAELLKAGDAASRAYACETLHNISKKDSTVFLPDGRGREHIGSFVIRALINVLQSGEVDSSVTAFTMEKACRLVCYILTDDRGAWKTSLNHIYDETALIEELAKVVGEEGPGDAAATEWAIDALLRGTRGLKAVKRREIIKETAGDALRYALGEDGAKLCGLKTKKRLEAIMAICKIPRESDESELTCNIKIIKRSISATPFLGAHPYQAEHEARLIKAMAAMRKAVSSSSMDTFNENCREICESGVLQRMVILLSSEAPDKCSRLEFEAAWACTNIASGLSEFCVKLVTAGLVPCLVRLLNGHHADVQDQALWALANIAGDGSYCRNAVLEAGVVAAIVRAHQDGILSNLKSTSDLAFLCRNIMKTKPLPHLDETKDMIPVLAAFLHRVAIQPDAKGNPEVENIIIETLHALRGFTSQDEKDEMSMDIMVKTRCLPIIIGLVHDHMTEQEDGQIVGNCDLINPALQILSLFCSGNEGHTQYIIDINGIELMFKMSAFHHTSIRKLAWFTLSNVSAGTPAQIRELVKRGVFNRAYDVLANRNGYSRPDGTSDGCDVTYLANETLSIKEDVVWCICSPFEQDFSDDARRVMMEVLDCSLSSAGADLHCSNGNMCGLVALFEGVSTLINSDVKGEDRNKRLELAMKLMQTLELVTGPSMLSQRVSAELKRQGKKIIAILQICLQQHSTELSRITESVCDQVLQRIAEA